MSQAGQYNNNSKYDPRFCKQLVEHMATGCSFATFGAIAGVGYQTLKSWQKNYPEFNEAVELGQLVCMYTWEKIIVGQATGEIKGLPATTIFALKNYFPEKFKENTALAGSGNTIVVFDSGVPSRPSIESPNIPETKAIEIEEAQITEKPHNTQTLPDYLQASYITEDDI